MLFVLIILISVYSLSTNSIKLIKTAIEKPLTLNDYNSYIISSPIFTGDAKLMIGDTINKINNVYERYNDNNSTFLVVNGKIKTFMFFTHNSFVEIINGDNHSIRNEYLYNISNAIFKGNSTNSLVSVFSEPIKNQEGIYEFFPGCFPGDDKINVFKMGVAVDYGVFLNLGSNINNVIDDIEQIVAIVRLVYLRQTQIRIDIDTLYIGDGNSNPPLNRNSQDGSCHGALEAFDEMFDWFRNNSIKTNFWMEISDCFTSIIGVSWIGSLCSPWYKYGVSSRDWLTFAHELGHAFGCTHSFENGVGSTGGIMDYGDGLYEGAYQFHPNKKSQLCGYVSELRYSPRYVDCIISTEETCGDTVMGPSEECECIKKDLKKCGVCQNCKLIRKPQCSVSNLFIMRYPSSKDYVSIYDSKGYTHKDCCIKNKLKGPKTLCDRKTGVCGVNGVCNKVCSSYLFGSKQCGFDTQGCKLGCTNSQKCDKVNVPDMTSCILEKRKFGVCNNGTCVNK